MFQPEFTYQSSFVSRLLDLEKARTNIQMTDLAYEAKTKLTQQAKALNLFHFSDMMKLEGMSLKDAEKAVLGAKPNFDDELEAQVFVNLRNTIDFLHSDERNNFQEFDHAVLTEINKRIIHNWKERWDAKYRTFNERFDETFETFGKHRDQTIQASNLELLMDDVVEWYKSSAPSVPAIIRIGVVLYKLLDIAPFIAANTFTTLLTVNTMLIQNGFGSAVYSSFVKIFNQNQDAFAEKLIQSRKTNEVTAFLELFVDLLYKDLGDAKEKLTTFIVKEEKAKKQPFLEMNSRQMKVLKYLQNIPTIKREEYCSIMEVSTMTAYRDLDELVRKKLLKIEGRGRGTKYRLANY